MLCAIFISTFVVGLTAAETTVESTCAVTRCRDGATCKEVYYPSKDVVRSACLAPQPPPGTGDVCADGQPLYVNTTSGIVEADCGRTSERIDCPAGYACNIHPFQYYAVCCPDPAQKPGRCPFIIPGERGISTVRCRSDHVCPRAEKCCPTASGGTSCRAPVDVQKRSITVNASCDTIRCTPGYTCLLRRLTCLREPCSLIAVCVPSEPEEGCPRYRTDVEPLCPFVNMCPTEGSCPNGTLCCYTPCGFHCLPPC